MEKSNICLSKTKNKRKQYLTTIQNYFSNLIIIKYFIENDEIDKSKDIIQSYYDEH